MDAASPGCLPTSLGTVWVGETKACIIDWPGMPWVTPANAPTYQPFTFIPSTPALSDADVERIAKRVVDLLRETKP